MMWGIRTRSESRPIHKIDAIMDQHLYVQILNDVFLPYWKKLRRQNSILYADNDPKHASKRANIFLASNELAVMDTLSQPANLNVIEALWIDVDKAIKKERSKM